MFLFVFRETPSIVSNRNILSVECFSRIVAAIFLNAWTKASKKSFVLAGFYTDDLLGATDAPPGVMRISDGGLL
jgi:predicted solute-binding protein